MKLKSLLRVTGGVALALGLLAFAQTTKADYVDTYGDVTVVTGPDGHPAWQLTSDPSMAGYAGVYVGIESSLTPTALTQLSASYVMMQGTFGGGAPRFSLIDSDGNEAYVYWGTPVVGGAFVDPNIGQMNYASTGNYADMSSPDIRVQVNGFGGYNSGATYQTWSQFLADPGVAGTLIQYITVDLDGGFTPLTLQQMDLTNFNVNGTVYTPSVPEPSTAALALLGLGGLVASIKLRRSRRA